MNVSKVLNGRSMLRNRATAIEFLTKVYFFLYFALSIYMSLVLKSQNHHNLTKRLKMKQRSFTHQSILLAIAILMIAYPSQASVVSALTLDDLLRGSTLIIQGEVKRIQSQFDPNHRTIYTELDIRYRSDIGILFDDAEKNDSVGRRSPNTVTLKLLGGRANVPTPQGVKKRILVVVGNPGFQIGERVLLFASPGKNEFAGFFRLSGMAQGKWSIENGVAKRSSGGAQIIGELQEELEELPLGELGRQIEQAIQKLIGERQEQNPEGPEKPRD